MKDFRPVFPISFEMRVYGLCSPVYYPVHVERPVVGTRKTPVGFIPTSISKVSWMNRLLHVGYKYIIVFRDLLLYFY